MATEGRWTCIQNMENLLMLMLYLKVATLLNGLINKQTMLVSATKQTSNTKSELITHCWVNSFNH